MNILNVPSLGVLDLLEDIAKQQPQSHLTDITLGETTRYISTCSDRFGVATFEKGTRIIQNGVMTGDYVPTGDFAYAVIPLMMIVSGAVTIIENGKAVKRKLCGDFIGEYEVAHLVYSGKTERIGKWDVVADTETKVLIFDRSLTSNNSASKRFARFLIELARRDVISNTVSQLPLLDWTAHHFSPGVLDDTMLVVSTHLLPSSVSLLRHLTSLVGNENVIVLEKAYSTLRSTYTDVVRMGVEVVPVLPATGMPYELASERSISLVWNKVVRSARERQLQRIVVFDDGGALLSSVPWERLAGVQVTGFEQTTSGLNRLSSVEQFPPVVNVAGCHAKREIEAQFIGAAIVKKLETIGLFNRLEKLRVGIIGVGAVGKAIAQNLPPGVLPVVYDFDDQHLDIVNGCDWSAVPSLDVLLNESDIIIGTTGTDCLKRVALDRVHGKKTLISASSSDLEFSSILNMAGFPDTAFGTVTVRIHDSLEVSVLNGGFPVNFDRMNEWESTEDIQLTRSLLYLGFTQALRLDTAKNRNRLIDLNQAAEEQVSTAYREFKLGRVKSAKKNIFDKQQWLDTLNFVPLEAEGGYISHQRSSECKVKVGDDIRNVFSTFYYMLTDDSPIGHFHRNRSDIAHSFHAGDPLRYVTISPDGIVDTCVLGPDPAKGHVLQLVVPGGYWKATELLEGTFGLLTEVVAPAFDAHERTVASRQMLLDLFPDLDPALLRLAFA